MGKKRRSQRSGQFDRWDPQETNSPTVHVAPDRATRYALCGAGPRVTTTTWFSDSDCAVCLALTKTLGAFETAATHARGKDADLRARERAARTVRP